MNEELPGLNAEYPATPKPKRKRKPNATPRSPTVTFVTIELELHEYAGLRPYVPGPSGQLGGYQRLVNWLCDHIDPVTRSVSLDPIMLERLKRCCREYKGGGPNSMLRAACIPPLRRAGHDPVPEWAAPTTPPDGEKLIEEAPATSDGPLAE